MPSRLSNWSPFPISTRAGFACVALVLAVANLASLVHGQLPAVEYRSDPPDPKAKANMGLARASVRDPSRYAAEKAKIDEYFEKFYFPDMTGTAPEDLARLGDSRYKLFKDYLWASTNAEFQQQLTNKAYTAMINVLKAQNPPYHPAVRFNAVLIIGMLDRQYGVEGSGAPEPLPQATKVLVAIVDSATVNDRFAPPVILGALIGLERHAQLRQSVAPDDLNKMTAAVLKLINNDKPIQDMDPRAYAWLRLRAASVLAHFGTVGPENSFHNAYMKLAGDLKAMDDRCAASALLAKVDYKQVKLPDPVAVEPLFKLARDLAAEEAKRAKEFRQQEIGSGGATLGGGGVGRGSYAPAGRMEGYGGGYGGGYGATGDVLEEQERFPRRHVLARITDLKAGLDAVKPAVPAETQAKIDAVLAALNPVRTQAVDKEVGELAFAGSIVAMASAVETAAAPVKAPATDPVDDDAEFQEPAAAPEQRS